MLDRLTGKSVHLVIHLLSCSLIAAGLPFSKIPLSLGIMLCILNVVLEADFNTYWKNIRSNKLAIGLWVFIAGELLSLLWSADQNYAMHDLKVKLPLYLLPLMLIAKPVTEKKYQFLICGSFLASLFITSFINVGFYYHWWGTKTYEDIRGLSLFGSHIRYALLIVMGIVICIGWMIRKLPYRFIAVLLILWFSGYTWFSQIISGYLVFTGVLLTGVLLLLTRIQRKNVKAAIITCTFIGIATGAWMLISFMKPIPPKMSMALKDITHYTVNGNWYRHDIHHIIWENGYAVVAYISDEELSKAWNAVSDIDYYTGVTSTNQPLNFTLWRYMASKGLYKDSVGFTHMKPADIHNVENGIASISLTTGGLKARLDDIRYELEYSANPNGHSLLQRLEYWKAARTIIGQHWLAGVGAGDVEAAFKDYYKTHDTNLTTEFQLRAHDQYFTSWISSGLLGICSFLAWWLAFLVVSWKRRQFVALSFCVIAILSFLIEDTIETHVGVTFIAFFYGLFATGYFSDIRNSEAETITEI